MDELFLFVRESVDWIDRASRRIGWGSRRLAGCIFAICWRCEICRIVALFQHSTGYLCRIPRPRYSAVEI